MRELPLAFFTTPIGAPQSLWSFLSSQRPTSSLTRMEFAGNEEIVVLLRVAAVNEQVEFELCPVLV